MLIRHNAPERIKRIGFTIPFFVRIPPKSLRFGHSVILSIALFTKVTVQYLYEFGYALLYA